MRNKTASLNVFHTLLNRIQNGKLLGHLLVSGIIRQFANCINRKLLPRVYLAAQRFRWTCFSAANLCSHGFLRLTSIRRVEVRILSHLALHFLALFFVVEQHEAVAEVTPLDFALGSLEQVEIALRGLRR